MEEMTTVVSNEAVKEQVCITNLSVRRFGFPFKGCREVKHTNPFDTVLLVVAGSVKAIMDDSIFTEFAAPHLIIMEQGHKYIFEAQEDNTELYEIAALRDSNGDIVDPTNLVRANYPFNPDQPFEDTQK